MDNEPKLNIVNNIRMCDLCLDGEGGVCGVPGCIMCRSVAPDIPKREEILLSGGTITPEKGAE